MIENFVIDPIDYITSSKSLVNFVQINCNLERSALRIIDK